MGILFLPTVSDSDVRDAPERAEPAKVFTLYAHYIDEDDDSETYDEAVRLLARRALSAGELHRDLVQLGHDRYEAADAVSDCETNKYLDDQQLAHRIMHELRERKQASKAQIRVKLRKRLIPETIIDELVAEISEEEEHALLWRVAHERARKLGDLDAQTAERRLLGFLARRGWSGEHAVQAAREALAASR